MKINSLTDKQQEEFLDNASYGISNIVLYEKIQHFCPLGEQVAITSYKIIIKPKNKLAELIDLHYKYLSLSGTKFTLESGLRRMLDITKEAYSDAEEIIIIASCEVNRHMAGEFTISYKAEN